MQADAAVKYLHYFEFLLVLLYSLCTTVGCLQIFKRRPTIMIADEDDLQAMNTDPVSFSLSS